MTAEVENRRLKAIFGEQVGSAILEHKDNLEAIFGCEAAKIIKLKMSGA